MLIKRSDPRPDPWHNNEREFHRWFLKNYRAFGLSQILIPSQQFPDVVALDLEGNTLNIELEYRAESVKTHRGSMHACDLVIAHSMSTSTAKTSRVCGVPVMALFVRRAHDYHSTQYWDAFKSLGESLEDKLVAALAKKNDLKLRLVAASREVSSLTRLIQYDKIRKHQSAIIELERLVLRAETIRSTDSLDLDLLDDT